MGRPATLEVLREFVAAQLPLSVRESRARLDRLVALVLRRNVRRGGILAVQGASSRC